ncbi:hypothetical protein GW17_00018506 [Ensete ventricosum]|nr:hypothetical protein GW17_00018506 [Ensete ventricosum]
MTTTATSSGNGNRAMSTAFSLYFSLFFFLPWLISSDSSRRRSKSTVTTRFRAVTRRKQPQSVVLPGNGRSFEQGFTYRSIPVYRYIIGTGTRPVPGGMHCAYRPFAREPIREPPTTARSTRYSLVSNDTGLFRVVTIKFSTVTTRNRSVTIDFDRDRPLPAWLWPSYDEGGKKHREGRRKRRRSKKRENRENLNASDATSLDDPDPGGNDEVATRATKEMISFSASSMILRFFFAVSLPKAGDVCGLRHILRRRLKTSAAFDIFVKSRK